MPIHRHPLLVLAADAAVPHAAEGTTVRIVAADDQGLASALTVQQLGFGTLDTAIGSVGTAELAARTAATRTDGSVERTAERIRAGYTTTAAAFDGELALCAGQHNPVGAVTEIVGVATLPSARRRGLGHAVTAALVADARARGVTTVFLSADDEDVARIYGRIGFVPVGTAVIAEVG